MKSNSSASEVCKICGHWITDGNISGIGFGCMKNVVQPATKEVVFALHGLDIHVDVVAVVRVLFLQTFEGRKFRSDFKKSFFASMQTAERISKKQLEIMCDWLSFEISDFQEVYKNAKMSAFEKYQGAVKSTPEYKEAIDKHFKLYFGGKKTA